MGALLSGADVVGLLRGAAVVGLLLGLLVAGLANSGNSQPGSTVVIPGLGLHI